MTDLASAIDRQSQHDNQSSRRELIRTLFSAVEGLVWTYREHVVEAARFSGILTEAEEAAFSEKSYLVTDRGKIVEQARFIPLLAAIRLTTQVAVKIASDVEANFATTGWRQFRQAIKIRHRVTHPKSQNDLTITEQDVFTCREAFNWLFELCLNAMNSVTAAQRSDLAQFVEILDGLKRGDPKILAEYRAAANRLDK